MVPIRNPPILENRSTLGDPAEIEEFYRQGARGRGRGGIREFCRIGRMIPPRSARQYRPVLSSPSPLSATFAPWR